MIILKESSEFLEAKRDSILKDISELNNKICLNKKELDDKRKEKYHADRQKDEAEKRINLIKKEWIFSFLIIIFLFLFMYSISISILILLCIIIPIITLYRSKNFLRDWDEYTEQNSISLGLEKKIENYSEIISQNYGKLKELNKKYDDYDKGLKGERDVTETLNELGYDNFLINDVTLDRAFGNIDHILVSRYGIFIIETKNWKGNIICEGDNWKLHYENDSNNVDYGLISLSKRLKGNAKKLRTLIECKIFKDLMNVWS